ncbi:hypothetical protein CLTEP_20600 [Clostridium tepidiprofundi DSM 19306]|uniref:Uncharacterized protein n=1 Tax=Clostridium tepidiprofundi DSM 19306 TaxID=1121338 RepID=A0A151B281_9CLOT|nr:hypothetical protein CLTEP_20600 [Clostridium tepidiprofundi DSM 19306]
MYGIDGDENRNDMIFNDVLNVLEAKRASIILRKN